METEPNVATKTPAKLATETKMTGTKPRSSLKRIATQAALMGAMAGTLGMGREGSAPSRVPNEIEANGVKRTYNPWDTVQLTKAQRKGKSFEELQALRKSIWAGPLNE